MKNICLVRKLRRVGREKVSWTIRFTAAAYKVTRMKRLSSDYGAGEAIARHSTLSEHGVQSDTSSFECPRGIKRELFSKV